MNALAYATPAVRTPTVKSFQLDNGLRVVTVLNDELPLVASLLTYDAGSRHDPEGRCGLAHLAEHLAYSGGDREGVHYPKMVERRGGQSNAITSHDATRFFHLVPKGQLSLVLWIEAQRMAEAATLELEGRLEVERQAVLQELRQELERRRDGQALERLHAQLFAASHPYHRPPIGRSADLLAIDGDQVRSFLAQHYVPSRAVLVLAGSLPDNVEAQVDQTLGRVAGTPAESGLPVGVRGAAKDVGRPALPGMDHRASVGQRRWQKVADRVPGIRCHVTYRTDGFGSAGATAATLVAEALGVGTESLLHRSLVRAQGIALAVGAMVTTLRDATSLTFQAVAAPGVTAEELETALDEGVTVALGTLNADAVRAARRRTLLNHYFRLQMLAFQVELTGRWMQWHGQTRTPWSDAEQLAQLEPDTVLDWARELARHGASVGLSVVPQEEAV